MYVIPILNIGSLGIPGIKYLFVLGIYRTGGLKSNGEGPDFWHAFGGF